MSSGASRGRSALAAAGIGIGVFSIVLISVLGETGTAEISGAIAGMGVNSVMVQAGENTDILLSDGDVEALSEIKGVEKAAPLISMYTESVLIDDRQDSIVWGVDENSWEIISLTAKHGRLLSKSDTQGAKKVCVIDSELAENAYGRSNIVGKTIKLYLGGEYQNFAVVGVARSGMTSLRGALPGFVPGFVYIPCTTMQNITGLRGYDKIAVLTLPEADSEAVEADINRRLSLSRGGAEGISVSNLQQQKGRLDGILATVKLLLSSAAGISLLVSGITVMTTMLSRVTERRREIGIKKAIGAKNSLLAAEFLKESLVITATGGVCGIALGLIAAFAGCKIMGLTMSADFSLIAAAFLAAIVLGAVFSLYPALKAASMEPVDALRQ